MNNLKTFDQYNLNEEINWKKYLNKLRWLGLAMLVTFISCDGSKKKVQYRGNGVVTSTRTSLSNMKTPETITINTSDGEIKVEPYNWSSSTREPFEVKRGDTVYVNIGQSSDDYIVKVEKGQQTISSDVYDIQKLPGDESNW